MLSITLVCVGKMRETYYISAFAEYAKRLGAYCRFDLVELPEQRLPERRRKKRSTPRWKKRRQAIRARIPEGRGRDRHVRRGQTPLERGARAAARRLRRGRHVEGVLSRRRSFGLDEGLKREASLRLSMSPMTFPHHLARVMLAEQIYRACTINAGTQYHK